MAENRVEGVLKAKCTDDYNASFGVWNKLRFGRRARFCEKVKGDINFHNLSKKQKTYLKKSNFQILLDHPVYLGTRKRNASPKMNLLRILVPAPPPSVPGYHYCRITRFKNVNWSFSLTRFFVEGPLKIAHVTKVGGTVKQYFGEKLQDQSLNCKSFHHIWEEIKI